MTVRVKMTVIGTVGGDHVALKLVRKQLLREPEQASLLLSQSWDVAL